MDELKKFVPLEEAAEQVGVAAIRLALIHLAFSKILVEELGEEKGKEAVLKAIIEYGRMVGERTKLGYQDLPFYGFHEKLFYGDQEFIDMREKLNVADNEFDFSRHRVRGCVLAKIFQEYGKKEVGCLYCYVDAAKSMAADPNKKLVHTACEVLGDRYCAFEVLPTTEKERKDFDSRDLDWKQVDPILVKGSGMGED